MQVSTTKRKMFGVFSTDEEMYSIVDWSSRTSTGRLLSEIAAAYCYGNLFLNLQNGHIQSLLW
jgi:hypothetical protein